MPSKLILANPSRPINLLETSRDICVCVRLIAYVYMGVYMYVLIYMCINGCTFAQFVA